MTNATPRRRVGVYYLLVMTVMLAATGDTATLRRREGGRGSAGRDGAFGGRTGGVGDGRTGVVVAFETPDQEQFQYGRPGEAVFGAFSWVSPEGVLVVMRYVADAAGYRVVGGPVPRDSRGVAAGGEQVFPRAADGSLILT